MSAEAAGEIVRVIPADRESDVGDGQGRSQQHGGGFFGAQAGEIGNGGQAGGLAEEAGEVRLFQLCDVAEFVDCPVVSELLIELAEDAQGGRVIGHGRVLRLGQGIGQVGQKKRDQANAAGMEAGIALVAELEHLVEQLLALSAAAGVEV